MKKLFFKVSQIKDDSLLPLIKEINKISCKICINLNKGMVDVENVEENMLETVIGLVNDYFSISNDNNLSCYIVHHKLAADSVRTCVASHRRRHHWRYWPHTETQIA